MDFGALETGINQAETMWLALDGCIKSFSKFFGCLALTDRYVVTCVVAKADKMMIRQYIGAHADGKWEYSHHFVYTVSCCRCL